MLQLFACCFRKPIGRNRGKAQGKMARGDQSTCYLMLMKQHVKDDCNFDSARTWLCRAMMLNLVTLLLPHPCRMTDAGLSCL